jgi:hypothetical protein
MYTHLYTHATCSHATPYVIAPDNTAFTNRPVLGYATPAMRHLRPLSRMTACTCHLFTWYRGTHDTPRMSTQHIVCLVAPTDCTYARLTALLQASASPPLALPLLTCAHARWASDKTAASVDEHPVFARMKTRHPIVTPMPTHTSHQPRVFRRDNITSLRSG